LARDDAPTGNVKSSQNRGASASIKGKPQRKFLLVARLGIEISMGLCSKHHVWIEVDCIVLPQVITVGREKIILWHSITAEIADCAVVAKADHRCHLKLRIAETVPSGVRKPTLTVILASRGPEEPTSSR
jgi:hypothetical protein